MFLRSMSMTPLAARARARQSTYSLIDSADGKTLEAPDGSTVLTYLVRRPEGIPLAGNSVCCFHPVNTLSGERVTDIAPPDHRDHRGIFFAWLDVEVHRQDEVLRGDFWGWGKFAPTNGRVIQNRDIKLVNADAKSAELMVANEWTIEGEKVLNENCHALVTQWKSVRILDLAYRFTSPYPFRINRVAFSGFCVRCRKDGEGYFSGPKGRVDLPDSNPLHPEMNWPASPWYSYTLHLTSGKTVACAVIDHPANPLSTWHEPRPVAFLNPCVSALSAVTVGTGQSLVLRYRVAITDGELEAAALDELSALWRGSSSKSAH